MQPISHKERRYLEKWKVIRENKWRYVFVHGVLFSSLPTGLLIYFFNIRFVMSQFDLSRFIIELVVFSVAGIGWGYMEYKARDKRFKQVYPLQKE